MTTISKNVRPTVYGTGLIALDLVINNESSSPLRAWAGGTCGNVLSILAYLGWNAFPIARMNGDSAAQRVKEDMQHCGVKLDFAACEPTTHVPIIVQKIKRDKNGAPSHHFSMACPTCGRWLPSFKSVTANSIELLGNQIKKIDVFFMDRLSRASLLLAMQAAAKGALVVYEPSVRADQKFQQEALKIAHIVKYSDQRFNKIDGVMGAHSSVLLEVQTLGLKGLRFRHRLNKCTADWEYLAAVKAPQLIDACGSGDWCTAGLLAKIARNGQKGLRSAKIKTIREGLRYGQALAAWNCGFEGARGGMYQVKSNVLDSKIDKILKGCSTPIPRKSYYAQNHALVACPACP